MLPREVFRRQLRLLDEIYSRWLLEESINDVESSYDWFRKQPELEQLLLNSIFPYLKERKKYTKYFGFIEAIELLASEEWHQLILWRKHAHNAFDRLWKHNLMGRREAYEWLSEVMGIPKEEAHMSYFSVAQCKEVVRRCKCPPKQNYSF